MAEDKLICVGKFDDYIQAEMARQVLADCGIEAIVTGANASNVYSALSFVERPELMVMSGRAEEAKEILAQQPEPLAEDQEIEEIQEQ